MHSLTADRVTIGSDVGRHGRPYGGRAGGEGAHQPRQPDRPDYPATGAIPTQQ